MRRARSWDTCWRIEPHGTSTLSPAVSMSTSHRSRSTGSASFAADSSAAVSKPGARRERTVDNGAPLISSRAVWIARFGMACPRPVERLGVFAEVLEAVGGRHLGDDRPARFVQLPADTLAVAVTPAEGGGHRQCDQHQQDDDADRQQITHAGALCYQSMESVIVRYQEIALKGRNRPWFVERLVTNLRAVLADVEGTRVRALMGRIEVIPGPNAAVGDGPGATRAGVRHSQFLPGAPRRPQP